MSLKTRLLLAGLAAVAAIVVTAGVGLFGMSRSNSGLETSITSTTAVLHQKHADMMHDALRGDVLFALVTGPDGDAADRDSIRADLADHVADFEQSIAALQALPLAPEIRNAVDEVVPALEAYIVAAQENVALGLSDVTAGREDFPHFMTAFTDLEERMETLGELIEQFGNSAGSAATATNNRLIQVLLAVSAIAMILLIIVNWLTAGGISRPILGMVDAMQRLARGDQAVEIPGLQRGDEVGRMAEAVQVFKENAIKTEELKAAQSRDLAAREERTQRLEQLCRDFDRHVTARLESVIAAVAQVEGTAQSMSRVAEDTAAEAGQVNQASEAATGNVNAVAAATEQLAASIAEIGQQMGRSREIAGQASTQASNTNAQIRQLADAAQRIGAVVQLITDIASQTNLLALNATIEAARAGEAGKGFAVVASEVKNLATQTGKATDEIAQQINGIQNESGAAVAAIESIAGTIDEINQITGGVAAAVEQQSAATKEIARSVEQAAGSNQEMSTRITTVSRAASETGTAAGQLLESSNALSRDAQDLRQEVEQFLATIRTI
ncbi:methyl-accepting chemotaxis protein [Dongia mobilis]|nr:methyl-accepting chemotaxis protein [Dongia mobilis]